MAPEYLDFPEGGVRSFDPDGLYLNLSNAPRAIQIISVGPLAWTPGEIAAHHPAYRLVGVEIIPPGGRGLTKATRQKIIGRLFLSIDLEQV